MKSQLLITILIFNCVSSYDDTNLADCKEYDLNSILNLEIENRLTIIYNSESCYRCFQKLNGFQLLQFRFEQAKYTDLLFILITTERNNSEQFKEIEAKAGKVIVMSSKDVPKDLLEPGTTSIFDKCSRLTYKIFPHFNELQYHILKAAILSSIFDNRCNCKHELNDSMEYDETSESIEEESTTKPEDKHEEVYKNFELGDYDDTNETDTSYIIPLKIILPIEHIHSESVNDSLIKYNFMILNTNGSLSHDHFNSDGSKLFVENNTSLDTDELRQVEDTSIEMNNTTFYIDKDGVRYRVKETYLNGNNSKGDKSKFKEISPVYNVKVFSMSDQLNEETENKTKKLSLVDSLHQWLAFKLLPAM